MAVAGFGRVAVAGLLLVLAAVVVTMSGGAGVAGRLGSLFGVQSHEAGKRAALIEVAGPVKAVVESVTTPAAQIRRPAVRRRVNARRPATRTPRQSPAPVAPRPAPALPPSASPSPLPKPPPAPAPGGNVQHAVDTVRDTAAPAVPQAKPVLDQTAQAVSQACGLIGGCP